MGLGVMLLLLGWLGWIAAKRLGRTGIPEQALAHRGSQVTILLGMTAAGLVSFAFLGQRLGDAGGFLWLSEDSELSLTTLLVGLQMTCGAAGLLYSSVATLIPPSYERAQRLVACAVAMSCVIVVALFPAILANILDIASAEDPPAAL